MADATELVMAAIVIKPAHMYIARPGRRKRSTRNPAHGGPTKAAIPRRAVRIPKAEVKQGRPSSLRSIGDVQPTWHPLRNPKDPKHRRNIEKTSQLGTSFIFRGSNRFVGLTLGVKKPVHLLLSLQIVSSIVDGTKSDHTANPQQTYRVCDWRKP